MSDNHFSNTRGPLVIIGGAEDKEGDCKILREFVRYAGGREARIAIMTAATDLPGEVGANYINVFERLGVKDAQIVDSDRREDADDPRALEVVRQATGVFFTGGKQERIVDLLKGTQMDRLLHERYAQGLVVGGTSAGASVMSSAMIVTGDAETHPRPEIVETNDGLSFLPEVVVDQHFSQRGRLGRLLAAIAEMPRLLGLGIDENTAVIVNGDEFTVVGAGSVTVVDLQNMTHCNFKQLLSDENLAFCNVGLHILPDGYRFNLKTRSPITEPAMLQAS